jgi:hypothetical protein
LPCESLLGGAEELIDKVLFNADVAFHHVRVRAAPVKVHTRWTDAPCPGLKIKHSENSQIEGRHELFEVQRLSGEAAARRLWHLHCRSSERWPFDADQLRRIRTGRLRSLKTAHPRCICAQLYPLHPDEPREARLEVQRDGGWKEVAEGAGGMLRPSRNDANRCSSEVTPSVTQRFSPPATIRSGIRSARTRGFRRYVAERG